MVAVAASGRTTVDDARYKVHRTDDSRNRGIPTEFRSGKKMQWAAISEGGAVVRWRSQVVKRTSVVGRAL